MTETLYNTRILRLAASIPHAVRLDAPQASVLRVSPVCGSRVTVDLDLDAAGRVVRFGQEVRACALGQASAALLGAQVVGRSGDELASARDALAAFLRGDAATPGAWPGLDLFAPARPHKARHGSILLAFEAAAAAAQAGVPDTALTSASGGADGESPLGAPGNGDPTEPARSSSSDTAGLAEPAPASADTAGAPRPEPNTTAPSPPAAPSARAA